MVAGRASMGCAIHVSITLYAGRVGGSPIGGAHHSTRTVQSTGSSGARGAEQDRSKGHESGQTGDVARDLARSADCSPTSAVAASAPRTATPAAIT
jgi:hypothetical protein